MPKRTLYLAAYDVTDPDRLERALYIMKNYASGGQKSVFECYLSDRERDRLVMDIEAVLDWRTDRFPAAATGRHKSANAGDCVAAQRSGFLLFSAERPIMVPIHPVGSTLVGTLYLDRKSLSLSIEGKRLVITEPGVRPRTVPMAMVERVVLRGQVQFDSGVLAKLAEQGSTVVCLSARHNRRTAMLVGPGHGDARRRLAQYQLALDESARLPLVRGLIAAKLQAQNKLLEQAMTARPEVRRCTMRWRPDGGRWPGWRKPQI